MAKLVGQEIDLNQQGGSRKEGCPVDGMSSSRATPGTSHGGGEEASIARRKSRFRCRAAMGVPVESRWHRETSFQSCLVGEGNSSAGQWPSIETPGSQRSNETCPARREQRRNGTNQRPASGQAGQTHGQRKQKKLG